MRESHFIAPRVVFQAFGEISQKECLFPWLVLGLGQSRVFQGRRCFRLARDQVLRKAVDRAWQSAREGQLTKPRRDGYDHI
jgi:hypothetical protein